MTAGTVKLQEFFGRAGGLPSGLKRARTPALRPRKDFVNGPGLSGDGFGLGRGFSLGFGLGGRFLPLQIGLAAFSFLSFVVLLAHNTLYIPDAFRLFSAL